MKYRLMEVADLYSEYIKQLDFEENLSYEELHRKVLDDCYSESDYIHRYLKEEYKLETEHVYYNFTDLQNRWDRNEDKDPFSVLIRQIKSFQPDVILVLNLWFFTKKQLDEIRGCIDKQVHLIAYHFTSIDDYIKEILPEYELVMTGSKYSAKELMEYASNVKVLRHAFEPQLLTRLNKETVINKVGFVGSIVIGRSIHTNRIDLFSELIKKGIPFDYYGKLYGSFLHPKTFLVHFIHEPTKMLGRIKTEMYLRRICKPSLFGIQYYNCIRKYAINLNIHGALAGTGAGNQRMFEVTGVGSCLVTDYKEENGLLFDEGLEIISYKNYCEMVEKIKWLLDCPQNAKEIAEAGQRRTLKEHNYYIKAIEMNSFIQNIIDC